jgi:hypothetical protein
MKRLVAALTICTAAMLPTAGIALADNVHLFTNVSGQPDSGGSIVNCGAGGLVSTPGNANPVNSMGSPFGTTAFAGTKYAGSQPQNSNNPNSISQYDVACFQATAHGMP